MWDSGNPGRGTLTRVSLAWGRRSGPIWASLELGTLFQDDVKTILFPADTQVVTSNTRSAQRRAANRVRSAHPNTRVRARPIIPGTRYKVTRRCLSRQFLLVPSPAVNEIVGYWLAVCLERHGLELHSACFMSNHYHLDVTDTHGNLPAFKNHFNAVLARALNTLRERFDKFWSEDRPCDVRILTEEDMLPSMAYTLANPVEAGLVKWAWRWPGFTTAGMHFGETTICRRPSVFFDGANDELPDAVTLVVTRPQVLSELSDEQLHAELERETRTREVAKHDQLRQAGKRFLGEARVGRQRWTDTPQTREARFTRTPTRRSANKWARIATAQLDRAWQAAYAAAREMFLVGGREVLFPFGSYWVCRFAGAQAAPSP